MDEGEIVVPGSGGIEEAKIVRRVEQTEEPCSRLLPSLSTRKSECTMREVHNQLAYV